MDGGAVAQWVGTGLVAAGLAATWIKNGKSQAKSDTVLKTELKASIKGIQDKLDDPNDGLGAIKREINGMKEHCAAVTSGCAERFKHVEDDVHRLEKVKE